MRQPLDPLPPLPSGSGGHGGDDHLCWRVEGGNLGDEPPSDPLDGLQVTADADPHPRSVGRQPREPRGALRASRPAPAPDADTRGCVGSRRHRTAQGHDRSQPQPHLEELGVLGAARPQHPPEAFHRLTALDQRRVQGEPVEPLLLLEPEQIGLRRGQRIVELGDLLLVRALALRALIEVVAEHQQRAQAHEDQDVATLGDGIEERRPSRGAPPARSRGTGWAAVAGAGRAGQPVSPGVDAAPAGADEVDVQGRHGPHLGADVGTTVIRVPPISATSPTARAVRSTGTPPKTTPFDEPLSTISTRAPTMTRAWVLEIVGSLSQRPPHWSGRWWRTPRAGRTRPPGQGPRGPGAAPRPCRLRGRPRRRRARGCLPT